MKFFLFFFSLRNDSNDLCKQYFCENFTEEVVVKTITTIMNFPSKKNCNNVHFWFQRNAIKNRKMIFCAN